jgi:allantoinase
MIDDRDYVGYGANPPNPQWPGGARIAVNINLNFEGGGERSVMDGDGVSEGALNDIGFPSLRSVQSDGRIGLRIRLARRRLAVAAPVP